MIIMSFGYKYGLPEANHYHDITFLKNPARKFGMHNGLTKEMIPFVLEQPEFREFVEKSFEVVKVLDSLDGGQVVAYGCNSGRHRSIIVAEYIAKMEQQV